MALDTSTALEQMENKLERLGLTTDKTHKSVRKTLDGINSLTVSGKIGKANTATMGVANAITGSIDKFSSGDTLEILSGSMDLVGALSQFGSFFGPEGAAVAAVVGPICSLLSGIFSMFGSKSKNREPPEKMLQRVVTEALAVQTDNELQSLAAGEMQAMEECIRILNELCAFENLSDEAITMISDREFLVDGANFMARLQWYIDKDLNTKDRNTARRTANLIKIWVILATLRAQELAMLQTLYGMIGAHDLASVTESTQTSLQKLCKTNLEKVSGYPDWPGSWNHRVYGELHLALSEDERQLVEKLAKASGTPFEGDVVRIRETTKNQYLVCGYDKNKVGHDRGLVFSYRCGPMEKGSEQWKRSFFRYISFREMRENFVLINFYDAGYVYSAEYKPIDKDRHTVNTWKVGDRCKNSTWTMYNGDTYCVEAEVYMYVSEYKAFSSEYYRVCTWMPGNAVRNGAFVYEKTRFN